MVALLKKSDCLCGVTKSAVWKIHKKWKERSTVNSLKGGEYPSKLTNECTDLDNIVRENSREDSTNVGKKSS